MAETHFDVAIIGGGLAGLTLALQLKQATPELSIAIIEKLPLPYPVAAHKIGESTVELGSHYIASLLGEDYLEKNHIRKGGVRIFFSSGDNRDLKARTEFGTNELLPIHTYQVDRGILENDMWARASEAKVAGFTESTVESIGRKGERHVVRYQRNGEQQVLTARWLIDCSGRASVLKNRFDLAMAVDHSPSASWLRISKKIDVEGWVECSEWKGRVKKGLRWRATNHLVGPGYWVWIIPLASGSTSVGIVASPDYHPFRKFRTLDSTLQWLRDHEPLLAAEIDCDQDKIQDFGAQRHFAHGCSRVFSPDRWALSGEAGVFVDPFLSPGTDFIAISNHMISEMIRRDRSGEDITEYVEFANETYLQLFELLIGWFKRLYPVFDKDQALTLWVGWYFSLYIAVPVTLARHAHIAKRDFMISIQPEMNRFAALSEAGIKLLADYAQRGGQPEMPAFVDICDLTHVIEIQHKLTACESVTDDEVRSWLAAHLEMLEATVVKYHQLLGQGNDHAPSDTPFNPYSLSGMDANMLPRYPRSQGVDARIAENIHQLWFSGQQ